MEISGQWFLVRRAHIQDVVPLATLIKSSWPRLAASEDSKRWWAGVGSCAGDQ